MSESFSRSLRGADTSWSLDCVRHVAFENVFSMLYTEFAAIVGGSHVQADVD